MKSTLIIFALIIFNLNANSYKYSANLNSSWELTKNTNINCELSHNIPNYGLATFNVSAGQKKDILFNIEQFVKPNDTGILEIYSKPPAWKHGFTTNLISTLKIYKNFSMSLTSKQSNIILNELYNGFIPTFIYEELNRKIEVEVMPVRFNSEYSKFQHCISNLLNYSFEDISFSVIHFDKNIDVLNNQSLINVKKLINYIKSSENIKSIEIKSYTDSYGSRATNNEISQKRANIIKDLFLINGIKENVFIIKNYGEKKPVASNETIKGRDSNRRVIIKLTENI
jgi:outer membrane protein OmpA-like peptidoglycan-associated protein